MGCYEISLGDTIGIGDPGKSLSSLICLLSDLISHRLFIELCSVLLDTIDLPKEILAAHFHNTYDRAIPNLIVAFSKGIAVSDSSVAGIGGCPYAKGASGNVATEDVLYLLELLGINHGVNIESIMGAGDYISRELGRENLSRVSLADLEQLPERKSQIQALLA